MYIHVRDNKDKDTHIDKSYPLYSINALYYEMTIHCTKDETQS